MPVANRSDGLIKSIPFFPLHQSSFSLLVLLELFLEFNKRKNLQYFKYLLNIQWISLCICTWPLKMCFYLIKSYLNPEAAETKQLSMSQMLTPQLTTEENEVWYGVIFKAFLVWNKARSTCCQWMWRWGHTDVYRDRLESLTPWINTLSQTCQIFEEKTLENWNDLWLHVLRISAYCLALTARTQSATVSMSQIKHLSASDG